MLSRALKAQRCLPLRQKVQLPPSNKCTIAPTARRRVTTDAASSHAEKEHVPEVG